MPLPIVEEYWGGVVRRLQEEVDVFNRLVGHAGEQGRANELALARLFESLVPRNVGVGSGIIIDSAGRRSKQTDIILYDIAGQPSIMSQTNQLLFPVEVVHAAIEVKTTLTSAEIQDCGKKRLALDALQPHGGSKGPDTFVLAYHSQLSPTSMVTRILRVAAEERPKALCVVSPGILVGAGIVDPTGKEYSAGLAYLHERDEQGTRLSKTPVKLAKLPINAVHVLDGSSYPVTKFAGKSYLVGEPGRALVLFCDLLLRALASRQAIPVPVLSAYLNGTARETLRVETENV